MNEEIIKEDDIKEDDRSKIFFGVLNCPLHKDFYSWFIDLNFDNFNIFARYYAFIVHDRDIKENASKSTNNKDLISYQDFVQLKNKHIHFLIELPKRRRCNSVLKDVSNYLNIPLNCVSLRVCSSLSASLNYMLHYNQPLKYQYRFEEIKTNSYTWLFEKFNVNDNGFNEYIISCITESKGNYTYLLRTLGLEYCKKYKDIIYMLYKKNNWI